MIFSLGKLLRTCKVGHLRQAWLFFDDDTGGFSGIVSKGSGRIIGGVAIRLGSSFLATSGFFSGICLMGCWISAIFFASINWAIEGEGDCDVICFGNDGLGGGQSCFA